MKYILHILSLSVFIACFTPPPLFAQITSGSALEFYGHDQLNKPGIVKIPRTSVLASIGSSAFTIEWFMKSIPEKNTSPACVTGTDNWLKGNIIIDATQTEGIPDKGGFGVSLSGGAIAFGVEDNSQKYTICGNAQINDGNWHHIAITRVATNGLMSIFIDGQLDFQFFGPSGDISYNISRVPANELDPYIVIGGKKSDPDNQFTAFAGAIDEMKISIIKLYSFNYTVPNSPFIPDNNTLVLYHFDDCPGSTVKDDTSNTIDAKIEPISNPSSPLRINSSAPLTDGSLPQGCVTPTLPPACPNKVYGDANCDSLTNLSDFEVWRKEFTGDANTRDADFGNNNTVDLTDFEIWRKGFIGEV